MHTSEIIQKHSWTWVGHIIRSEPNSLTKTALHWTPGGERRGDQKGHGDILLRLKSVGKTWNQLSRLGDDCGKWGKFAAGWR